MQSNMSTPIQCFDILFRHFWFQVGWWRRSFDINVILTKFNNSRLSCIIISVVKNNSWKGQLEKTRSWKVRHEIWKNEVGKYKWSWKVTVEVGKFSIKLERIIESGKLLLTLERSMKVGKFNRNWKDNTGNECGSKNTWVVQCTC